MHLVTASPSVSKATKFWCLLIPNLVQKNFVNDKFISVNCLLHDKRFSFAGVYVVNRYLARWFLWRDIRFFTGPWCILRNFNVMLSVDDCKGGCS